MQKPHYSTINAESMPNKMQGFLTLSAFEKAWLQGLSKRP